MIYAYVMVAWMAFTDRPLWLTGWLLTTAVAVGGALLDGAPVRAVEAALMMTCLAPVVGWAAGGSDE